MNESFERLCSELANFRAEVRADFRVLRTEVGGIDKRLDGIAEDVRELRGDISGVRTDLQSEISGVRTDLQGEIGGVRAALQGEIGAVRGEIGGVRGEIVGIRGEITTLYRAVLGATVVIVAAILAAPQL